MKPNPHCRVRFKRWHESYRKEKHLGPVRSLQERRKAERTYELMQSIPLSGDAA